MKSLSRTILLLAIPGLLLILTWSTHSQESLQVGYAVIQADPGSPLPVSSAFFAFRNGNGVLISEAAVSAVAPIRQGRIFVDQAGNTSTGLALANPFPQQAVANLVLRNQAGMEIGQKALTLAPGQHVSSFVVEQFPSTPAGFIGSLSFEVDEGSPGLGAVTVRLAANRFGEPLFATLPVADLEESPPAGTPNDQIIFPHLGAGSILSTQILLFNTSENPVAGEIRLIGTDGLPLTLELDGLKGSVFPYELAGNGVFRGTLTSSEGIFQGYAQVTLTSGDRVPAGTAVFQFRDALGNLVSEAGVGATLGTTRARIFVDTAGTQTGVALAVPAIGIPASNPGGTDSTVQFELFDLAMGSLGVREISIPMGGQTALFSSDEKLFPTTPRGFTGILEIRSDFPIYTVTLKLTVNSRGDFILTTLPLADLDHPIGESTLVFPQIGFGLGFSTRLILINSLADAVVTGGLHFVGSDGQPLEVPLASTPVSDYRYSLPPGAGTQEILPNYPLAEILLESSEVTVTEGNTVTVDYRVIDPQGQLRTDVKALLQSLDSAVATVDTEGQVTGHSRGFSTLTLEAEGVIQTATITVVDVQSGSSGFDIDGLERDSAGRVYLASSSQQVILQADRFGANPAVYAGTGVTGLVNESRSTSRFNAPNSLVLNQLDGNLFVADRGNHAIRRISPGTTGRVDTMAGGNGPGPTDGPGSAARFRHPEGIALDGQGHLWVADTGNHTIRRISLASGMVETIAGTAQMSGSADGMGPAARFRTPRGIAVEREPLALQLARELRGEPPPPTTVLVSDTGNGILRRVREDGMVETVQSAIEGSAYRFESPRGVASDPFGTIVVGELGGRIRSILGNGKVVDAVQAGTFDNPGQIIASAGGLLVADREDSGHQVSYAPPQINAVKPERVGQEGGEAVTLQGSNFAPDSIVVLDRRVLEGAQVRNTGQIVFTAPPLTSGLKTVTVQHRGGINQIALGIHTLPLDSLEPGQVTTIAGGADFTGDGGPALAANLRGPTDVAVDSNGSVYVVDQGNSRIRRIDPATGVITTVAGTGGRVFDSVDGNLAVATNLVAPLSIAIDSSGNLLFRGRGGKDSKGQRGDWNCVDRCRGRQYRGPLRRRGSCCRGGNHESRVDCRPSRQPVPC